MRILFAFAGGSGHLDPLVPIARAARAAGHTVAFTGKGSIVSGIDVPGASVFPSGPDTPPERLPLREVDTEREDRDLRDGFSDRLARDRSAAVLTLCEDWRPDVIVCDETDFGSMVVAERQGLPYASVLVVAAGSFVRHEVVAEPLHGVRAEHGLPADPELRMLRRYLVLSPLPPGFRDPSFPLPDTAHSYRSLPLVAAGSVPPWPVARPGAPIVYCTLGTVFNLESGDLFDRVLAGLGDLPVNVLVTVGRAIDPGELGQLPKHIHAERYMPQAAVLPHCSAVVSHGGSGSVVGALAHGLPMVVLPMGADQPLNAARCEELGVGRALDAVGATPEMIGEAAWAVLSQPAYRAAAAGFEAEIAALPGPDHAVSLLERLGTERQPIVAR